MSNEQRVKALYSLLIAHCSELTMAKPSDVKHDALRDLLTAAYEALRRGDYTQSVRHSTEAVRQLLARGHEAGVIPHLVEPEFSE